MYEEGNAATPVRKKAKHQGIEEMHSRSCGKRNGERCTCKPTFRASAWSPREGRKLRRTFPTISAAKSWRADAMSGLRKGTMRAPTRETVAQAAEALIAGIEDGTIRTRGGRAYKPSVARSYRIAVE